MGDKLDLGKLKSQLGNGGYQNVDTVFQHGEFTVRGALIDIFPMGSDSAYRIELFDDEVESLREFDPETFMPIPPELVETDITLLGFVPNFFISFRF